MEGCQEFFKGYPFNIAKEFPDIGSVAGELLGAIAPSCPRTCFVRAPTCRITSARRGFFPSAALLGNWVPRVSARMSLIRLGRSARSNPLPGMSTTRLSDRRQLLDALSPQSSEGLSLAVRKTYEHAFDLLTSPRIQAAFDLHSESDAVRRSVRPRSSRLLLFARAQADRGRRAIRHRNRDSAAGHTSVVQATENRTACS